MHFLFIIISFKDAILSSSNLLEDNSNLASENSEKNVCAPPLLPATNSVSLGCVNDPPSDAAFPEVVDELSQVQKNIEELSKSCLLGKMLGEPLDVLTFVSRTKAEWKFVKGDIEFLEMGNHWIMLKFANPNDLFLVWSERPWHVQGELFLL